MGSVVAEVGSGEVGKINIIPQVSNQNNYSGGKKVEQLRKPQSVSWFVCFRAKTKKMRFNFSSMAGLKSFPLVLCLPLPLLLLVGKNSNKFFS